MIAKHDFGRGDWTRPLRALSQRQDSDCGSGRQRTFSQKQISGSVGVSRARIEQVEILAKLRFVKNLAVRYPQSFLDLGGTYEQLAFLQSIAVSTTNARRLWRQWCQIGR